MQQPQITTAKREDKSGTKLKHAEDLLHERKAEVAKGKQPEVKRIPEKLFRDFIVDYSEWMKGRHKSEHVKKYITKGLKERFGNVYLRQFNTLLVEKFQSDLIEKGYKNGYINKIANLLKAMINKAIDWEMVQEDVLRPSRRLISLIAF